MKLLLLILLSKTLFALCTLKETTLSDDYYLKASKETNPASQIILLNKALNSCCSPEIETSKILIQAESTKNIKKKISFYNQALVSISHFEDEELLMQEQNKINSIIASLYLNLDQQALAETIKAKWIDDNKPKKPRSFLWVIILFSLLSFWTVFNLFRMRKNGSL